MTANYNSKIFQITSQLAVCGHPIPDEEKIEKTLLTFHATNLILASQYRNMRFTKYSELIAYMLLIEKHQLLLLDNSKTRPPGTAPLTQRQESHYNLPNDRRMNWHGRGNFRGRRPRFAGRGRFQSLGGRGRGRSISTNNTCNN